MSAACRRSSAWLLAACVALTACSSHDTHTVKQASLDSITTSHLHLGDTANPFRSTGHTYGAPTGKIRIANLLELHGQPSGLVDIYDVRQPDSSTAPLIKHLAFGQISAYVSPRGSGPGSPSNLYLFQADKKTGALPFGTNIDNGGFQSTDQLTIALGPSNMGGSEAAIGEVYVEEAGKRLNKMVADSETALQAGRGLLIVRAANSNIDTLPEQYLMIDGTCPTPTYVGSVMLFPISPGAHTLGLVTSPHGRVLKSCAGHAPTSTISENVAAGQRYVVWMYGMPGDGFKVTAAPVAGS